MNITNWPLTSNSVATYNTIILCHLYTCHCSCTSIYNLSF